MPGQVKTLVKRRPKTVVAEGWDSSMKKLHKQELKDELGRRLIEQDDAISAIIPYITTYSADLHGDNRPVGSFFLLGPTGTGKTRTVEALAEVLHGGADKLIRVDCAQFSQSHEVAKLTGSPPGYLGHRETPPFFAAKKFEEARSKECNLTIVLFDEVEKAHYNLFQTLLSILDKGEMSLGDNSVANFKDSLVFFTSNLGAQDMQNTMENKFGFTAGKSGLTKEQIGAKLNSIGSNAVKKKFTPELINRLDEIITYKPLSDKAIGEILKISLKKLHDRLAEKTKPKPMYLLVTADVEEYIIKKGFSEIYGARELNRVVQRKLVQPLADLVVETEAKERLIVRTKLVGDEIKFELIPPRLFDIEVKEEK